MVLIKNLIAKIKVFFSIEEQETCDMCGLPTTRDDYLCDDCEKELENEMD